MGRNTREEERSKVDMGEGRGKGTGNGRGKERVRRWRVYLAGCLLACCLGGGGLARTIRVFFSVLFSNVKGEKKGGGGEAVL